MSNPVYLALDIPQLEPAKALVSEDLRNDPAVYPPEDVIGKLVDTRKLPLEENDARQRAWTTIKSGK